MRGENSLRITIILACSGLSVVCFVIYLFVCDLFSNTDSSSDYILPKEKIIFLVMHNKMKGKWAVASNLL